jgi:hypothetical protein
MAIALKEWALVCEALGKGTQSLLLRKGGIAEGPDGFGFKHQEFTLFPTWFHGQAGKVRSEQSNVPEQTPDHLLLNYAATIEWHGRITDKKAVERLTEFHVLSASVIDERFEYTAPEEEKTAPQGGKGIHVAFVRVYRLEPPVDLPMEKRFGGCRSWVEIPDITSGVLVSVLSNEEHERRRQRLMQLLGLSPERPVSISTRRNQAA